MTEIPHFSLPFRFGEGLQEGFDREGTDAPPSAFWTPLGADAAMLDTFGPIALSGDGRTATAGGPASVHGSGCYWNADAFPGDVDVWLTIVDVGAQPPGTDVEAVALVARFGGPDVGFRLSWWWSDSDEASLTLIRDSYWVPPPYPPLELANGDQLGLRVLVSEDLVEARHRPAGGSWRTVASWPNLPAPAGEQVGLVIGESMLIDDFSAAAVGAYPSEHPQAAVVEQDSLDEIADCALAVLLCPAGFRVELPEFGISDPAFTTVDPELLRAALDTWEPRAQADMTEEQIDELAVRVKVMLRLRSET